MKQFTRSFALLATIALFCAPLAAGASCTGLTGTFVGSGGVLILTANPTGATLTGALHSKALGDGTFDITKTDGASYGTGTIELTGSSAKQAVSIELTDAGVLSVTVGSRTWQAKCG